MVGRPATTAVGRAGSSLSHTNTDRSGDSEALFPPPATPPSPSPTHTPRTRNPEYHLQHGGVVRRRRWRGRCVSSCRASTRSTNSSSSDSGTSSRYFCERHGMICFTRVSAHTGVSVSVPGGPRQAPERLRRPETQGGGNDAPSPCWTPSPNVYLIPWHLDTPSTPSSNGPASSQEHTDRLRTVLRVTAAE